MKNYEKYSAGYSSRRQRGGNFSRSAAAAAAAMKYYSHGTQAAKIEDARDNVSLKYCERLVKIDNKIVARGSVAKIFCALIICFCAITVIFAKSMVYNYQLDNTNLKITLEDEKEKTASLIANSTERIDMEYVEQTAMTRLNMSKPQSYQIVYIEVPKTDYAVIHEATTVAEKDKPKLNSYKDIFKNLKEAGEVIMASKADSVERSGYEE